MEKHWKDNSNTVFGFVLFFFLGLFIYTKLAGPIPFLVNNYTTIKNDLFQTSGQGSASAAPDEATISFGVTKTAGTVEDAQDLTNTAIENILNNLKKLGVSDKDLKTVNYSVNPDYNFNGGQKISGYTVTQNIDLKLKDIKNTNKAVGTITASGANLVGQIQFGFTDGSKAKLEEMARKEAADDAKQKAQSLAKTAGINLGKIINVQESSNDFSQPIPFLAREKSDTSSPAIPETEIPTGENNIKISITLTYETY
ncbi:MAG: SIMPL domain-containing protein [Patescibacteria group bacterium]